MKTIYPYVRSEMAFRHLNIEQLRVEINQRLKNPMSYQLLAKKLRGESELTLDQAIAIWEALSGERESFVKFWSTDSMVDDPA